MSGQQPVIVNVEQVNRGCGCGGCLTFIAVLLIIGVAIEYWYIAVAIAVIAAIAGVLVWLDRRDTEPDGDTVDAKTRGELWASPSTTAVIDLCGNCGAQVDGAFCAQCGTARSARCSGCGQPLTSRYCPHCGTKAAD